MYRGRPPRHLEHPSGMQSRAYDTPGQHVPLKRELRGPDRFGLVREVSSRTGLPIDLLVTRHIAFMISVAIESGGARLRFRSNSKGSATVGRQLFTPEHTVEWLLVTSTQDHSHHPQSGELADNMLAVLGNDLFTTLDNRGVTLEAIRQRAEPLAIALEGLQRIVKWEDRARSGVTRH